MRRILLLSLLIFPFIAFSQIASIELVVKPMPEPVLRDTTVEKWNRAQPDFNTLSAQSKDFLYWVNLGRSNPAKFWDSVIVPALAAFPTLSGLEAKSLRTDLLKTGALPMFSLNSTLIRTAQLHSTDISAKSARPSHTGTDGTDFSTRMHKAGIVRCANENIAVSSQSTLLAVVLLYLDIGLPEKGHRIALLNPTLRETGIGSAPYGKEQVFFVQDISCFQ